ncbi:MAG: NAD(P)/FAD-dependent oxidoreductase [Solirubrobacteraceae bacterium]|nr:NAD(P)/FAD-dependent oxidoreductase [Solirubrobacteraceae bacterium]
MATNGPSVAIVGAGFGGLAAAIALLGEGITDLTVFEKSGDLGGVWRENTYPGSACDVPSYLYSFSYAQRRDWTRPCSPQAEIHDYLAECADRFGVRPHIRFSTEITRATWDEDTLRWQLELADGEIHEADVFVPACGQLSIPVTPSIPGRDTFAGHQFHSAQWDHHHDLRGERVAVVGTGASAVQFIPQVAEHVAHLDVFQRTPNYMLARKNPIYPAPMRWAIAHVPGVQRFRRGYMRWFMETMVKGLRGNRAIELYLRGWSKFHLFRYVRDRDLRRRLTPSYDIGCKRILFSSYFYEALTRDNVDLVDEAITEITPTGIVTADGIEHATDTIIWGTGFDAQAFVAPMEIVGTGGETLAGTWQGGAHAFYGLTVPRFPNMFLLYGPNTNLGVGSIIVMLEAQATYIADAVRRLRAEGGSGVAFEVREDVERAFDEHIQAQLRDSVWTRCNSWYTNDAGRVVNNWPGFMFEYERATKQLNPEHYLVLRATADEAVAA